MTREEKIEALIRHYVHEDSFGSFKDFNHFVADLLENGFKGYTNMADDELDQELSMVAQDILQGLSE